MTPIRLWLIEDNANYRKSLQQALQGIEDISPPKVFSSLEAALEGVPAPDGEPDVILLDVGLPGLDGITGLSDLRKACPGARIVILTVFEDEDKIFRAITAGASGYLLKSFDLPDIVSAIRQAHQGGAPMHPRVARRVLDLLSGRNAGPGENDCALTAQERRILELCAEGLGKKEIAHKIGVSVHTVSFHLRRIYEKLHVNTNTGAVAKAIRRKLI
ncbi:MAG: response regulator transcription factor [Bryobacteraceae bacterium]|nr:response regulator transcription factor [Bryobacteraceae bacterium]